MRDRSGRAWWWFRVSMRPSAPIWFWIPSVNYQIAFEHFCVLIERESHSAVTSVPFARAVVAVRDSARD